MLNYEIETDDDSYKLAYPTHRIVYMMDVRIHNLTAAMISQLKSVEILRVIGDELKILHIIPQFEAVDISSCRTEAVVIDPSGDFKLKNMTISQGELETLPKNLCALTQLELLRLPYNSITHVNTDEFSGLVHLRKIDLSRNRIVQISSTGNGVHLPRLQSFLLSFNELTDLNFEQWNASSLHEVDFSHNRLTIARSLVSSFPKLKMVRLDNNPLNCLWRDYIEKELLTRAGTTGPPLNTCDEKSVIEMVDTKSKTDEVIAPLWKALQKALGEIDRLHHLNDDLTEAFYRYTLEQSGNSIGENSNNQQLSGETIDDFKAVQIGQSQQMERFEQKLKTIERKQLQYQNHLSRHILGLLAQESAPEDTTE